MTWRRITATCVFSFLVALFLLLAAATLATTKKPPLKPVNINTATSEELQQVPGIGPATAEKILLMRKSYGAFRSVDDLLAIKGLGKKRLEKMRKYLTVSKTAALNKPACSGCAKPGASQAKAPPPKNEPPPSPAPEPEEPPRP
jgi:competence ComEA-like helix-hairpin-helix protein